jgi:hypothetical protein
MNQNPLFPAKITQKVDLQKDNYFVVFDRVIQFIPGQALSLSLEEGETKGITLSPARRVEL